MINRFQATAPSQNQSHISTSLDTESANIALGAIDLASQLLEASHAGQTAKEKSGDAQMARLMEDAAGKAFLFGMVDEVFRSRRPGVAATRWRGLISAFGLPKYPAPLDRALIGLGGLASRFVPFIVMPTVAATMRKQTANVILDGSPQSLSRYFARRQSEGFRVNLNHLGEAVLGEEEAAHRLKVVLGHIADPQVTYISVKISAIFSQINLLAWDETLEAIKEHLRTLYHAALPEKKFVNLDMEEYRDLALTVAAFCAVLDEKEFRDLPAGIVLQAYLPDSWAAQQQLTEWARVRVKSGGAPIKIRLVKGANLAMEHVEAETHGWFAAPYPTKADTDANFRRMMEFGCQPENAAVARLGLASHNLFDVALALTLSEKLGVSELVEIEMLEGMANHQARAVKEKKGGVLLYAPAVGRDDFLSAMAYLIRRLDENTSPENFLHDLFALEKGSPAWEKQRGKFLDGWNNRHTVSAVSRRLQPAIDADNSPHFENEPDTDWTQSRNRDALEAAIAVWSPPARPSLLALETVVKTATDAQAAWEKLGFGGRREILRACAQTMSAGRFETLACMRLDAKKTPLEGDAEVSEAIDFARYYADFEPPMGTQSQPLGVVVVTPPWNFPYAIPCGGILAALMAGNSVIFKPAPETVETAWLLARQLWEAGVPREVLQFFPCADGEVGKALICHPQVAAVILTGASQTARMFQDWRPNLPLFAETSGKNALVITAQSDRELAIKDLVRSAFGHSGQKCSAASLAIIEAEVYDAPDFRRQLRDAAASLFVGEATDPRSAATPLIQAPSPQLLRALTTLDEGEEWLLEPKNLNGDPCLWTPGIKLGVKAGSWFHQIECFGPVLGVMRAPSLEHAIEWQNATEYGLTAGIHTLDPREILLWRERVQAGNLYINRSITGAIVQRQPFGGWKKSSIGPGAKAGGPNYVSLFCTTRDDAPVGDFEKSYETAWHEHFSRDHDPSNLKGESNIFRYRPSRGVVLRLKEADEIIIKRAQKAAALTGVSLEISLATQESDAKFAARLPELEKNFEFLRTVGTPDDEVLRACHTAGLNWIHAPFTASGRQELRYWLREQAVSRTLHRYGQIPEWLPEERKAL